MSVPNDYLDRDPDTVAVYQRHPNIAQHPLIVARMTEKELLNQVRGLAGLLGWSTYHTLRSKGSEAGWPDLVLVRGPGCLFRELKTEKGRVSAAQARWLGLLTGAGLDAAIWRPRDLAAGRVAAELTGSTS